ncbi:hypothetical protein [Streptomyces sp. NPDC006307]|uniref:hypothetical protein n=1 Tax=Streptomyces sp. NPDC006307 TaxID=3156748 RepID=UPI0033AC0762
MKTVVWRWLLSPRTSWLAWLLSRHSDGNIPFDTAWRSVRVRLHPDEAIYRAAGHQGHEQPNGQLAVSPPTFTGTDTTITPKATARPWRKPGKQR